MIGEVLRIVEGGTAILGLGNDYRQRFAGELDRRQDVGKQVLDHGHERRLNAHVAARSYWPQCREWMLLVVSHNITILFWLEGFSTEQVGSRRFSTGIGKKMAGMEVVFLHFFVRASGRAQGGLHAARRQDR